MTERGIGTGEESEFPRRAADVRPREEHEESLRAPEPPSKLARVATVVWIILTVALMGIVAWVERDELHLLKHLLGIAGGSASLYAYAAHMNRIGDRSFD